MKVSYISVAEAKTGSSTARTTKAKAVDRMVNRVVDRAVVQTEKTCTCCGETKALSEFGVRSREHGTYLSECRPCKRQRDELWRAENPEKVKASYAKFRAANRVEDNERSRQWRLANPEKRREVARDSYLAHQDEVQEKQRAYYAANKERLSKVKNERKLAWQKANPDKAVMAAQRYRSQKKAAFIEDVDPKVVFKRDGGICGVCRKPVETEPSLDHIIPLSKGGLHSYNNIQLAHRRCNSSKGDKLTMSGG